MDFLVSSFETQNVISIYCTNNTDKLILPFFFRKMSCFHQPKEGGGVCVYLAFFYDF